HAQL
ncbi:hypothetical protein CP03DC29_0837B, partial [Chlamydia psittaci 03DC29]